MKYKDIRFRNKLIIFVLIAVLIVPMISYATEVNQMNNNVSGKEDLTRAKVESILSDETYEEMGMRIQKLKLKILEGQYKGKIINGENNIAVDMAYRTIVEQGQEVLVVLMEDETGSLNMGYVEEIVRDKYLFIMIILFVALMLIVGGLKGLKSILTLIIIGVAILKFMLPHIFKGENPVILAIITSIFCTIVTLLIIGGINKKTFSAIVGTIGGVLCAGIITYIIEHVAHLTGMTHETQNLYFIPQQINFNYQGLLLAGILLGALGAVMDVSMSISSSINEIYKANDSMSFKQLFSSGMNVGKDIMGTMSNTLLLAYTGTSLNLMILFKAYQIPLKEILNRDIIVTEIVRGLAGTIGLIFTIPITAIIASILLKRQKD